MKSYYLISPCIAIVFGCATASTFAGDVRVGDLLDATQVAARTSPEVITSGRADFRVLRTDSRAGHGFPAALPLQTKVVNAVGQIGLSKHEVRVLNASTATVKSIASELGLAPREIGASVKLQVTTLRFETFAQAAKARDLLEVRLPDAQVTLPISYATPKVK